MGVWNEVLGIVFLEIYLQISSCIFSPCFSRNYLFSNELWFFISQMYRFKNVIFEISPTEEVGDFEVKAKFMGVQMETFMLHYQVRTVLFNTGV